MDVKLPFTDDVIDALFEVFAYRMEQRLRKKRRPFTMKEFAEEIKVDVSTVSRWIKAGRINKVPNLGRLVRIPASELEKFYRDPS